MFYSYQLPCWLCISLLKRIEKCDIIIIDFSKLVSRLLVYLGIESDVIFSSDYRQGVRQQIAIEVRQALIETSLDTVTQ